MTIGSKRTRISVLEPLVESIATKTASKAHPEDHRHDVVLEEHPSSRRRCCGASSLSSPQGKKEQDADIYHDLDNPACDHDDDDDDTEDSNSNEMQVRSSWFRSVQWISSSAFMPVESGYDEERNRGGGGMPQPESQPVSLELFKDEIKSLQKQLIQVKRRLGPAAMACCEVSQQQQQQTTTSPARQFVLARRACNPYEVLGEGRAGGLNRNLFLNRSAIKLANIDAMLDFQLTATFAEVPSDSMMMSEYHNADSVHDEYGYHGGNEDVMMMPTTTVTTAEQEDEMFSPYDHQEEFTFVDLCAAPGGFSEYILKRCAEAARPCRGYGMSLQGDNEHGQGTLWKLQDSIVNSSGNHHAVQQQSYRVCTGEDGTGDIFHWPNIECLQQTILQDYNDSFSSQACQDSDGSSNHSSSYGSDDPQVMEAAEKVHLVMADGGFDAQRDAEDQEGMAQKLIVCQVAAALTLLRGGGTLIVKMFGFTTDVSRAVCRSLYQAFESMTALKPISSRPASAERYVVCTGFKGTPSNWDGPTWRNYILLGMKEQPFVFGNHHQKEAIAAEEGKTPRQGHVMDTMAPLNQFLMEFERDMLRLNLKACFSMLSYMQNKHRKATLVRTVRADGCSSAMDTTAAAAGPKPSTGEDDDDDEASSFWVDIQAYRQAWQLGELSRQRHQQHRHYY